MEFGRLGKHCIVCKTKDFLPFKCDHCGKIVCIAHREQKNHNCTVDITQRVSEKLPNVRFFTLPSSIFPLMLFPPHLPLSISRPLCMYTHIHKNISK
mmetsp:Transcript_30295/g.49381  ORF Transcript_30295/g.49381 Transcript_30295/m.49381 type:complete len:97 (+) Transcript_30295:109-399(+)